MSRVYRTFDTDQPWIVYTFHRSFDHIESVRDLLQPWRWTRLTGSAKIDCTCAVCGRTDVVKIRVPRFRGSPPEDKHPARARFNLEHLHPDRGHPMSWSLPLLNPAAHEGGIDTDLLAMRLRAELGDEAA